MLVGYEPGSKGYQLWDKHTHSVKLSRDVTFEDRMQCAQLLCEMDTAPRRSGRTRVPNPRYYNADNAVLPPRQHNAVNVLDVATAPAASAPSAAHGTSIASQASPLQATDVAPIARTATATMAASAVRTTPTDEVRQLALAELLAVAALAAIGRDPVSYKEAMEAADAEEWAEACQYEMDALSKNNTWELVNLPPGRKAIKSKWVFKLKSDGRFRARLVAKGSPRTAVRV